MKKVKIFAVLSLIAIFSICLIGCAKDDAVELNWDSVVEQGHDNATKVKEEWDGKKVKYTGTVSSMGYKNIEMSQSTRNGEAANPIAVSFQDSKTLDSLEKGDTITVVGTLTITYAQERVEGQIDQAVIKK